MRVAILHLACWLAVFAGAHLLQLMVVRTDDPDVLAAFSFAWGLLAFVFAPMFAWIIHRQPNTERKGGE